MSAISLMENQLRRCGKTLNMIQSVVKFATENPDSTILLCLPKHLPHFQMPPNITTILTDSMANVDESFEGSEYKYVAIDEHIKDLTIVEQAGYIRQLKKELATSLSKLSKLGL